jgi:hypothetical protein
MLEKQSPQTILKSYSLFFIWFFLHAILLLTCNVLSAFTLLGQGEENSLNFVGAISGGIVGLVVGLIQWLILWRYFSVSPLWIITCIIGFAVYYAVNWYSGAILMGVLQQMLLRVKVQDSFRWFLVSIPSLGLGGLLLLNTNTFCLYGAAYGLPTAALLSWYLDRLPSRPLGNTPLENA